MRSMYRRTPGFGFAAMAFAGGGLVESARAQSAGTPIPLQEGAGLLFFAALLPLLIWIFQGLRGR